MHKYEFVKKGSTESDFLVPTYVAFSALYLLIRNKRQSYNYSFHLNFAQLQKIQIYERFQNF